MGRRRLSMLAVVMALGMATACSAPAQVATSASAPATVKAPASNPTTPQPSDSSLAIATTAMPTTAPVRGRATRITDVDGDGRPDVVWASTDAVAVA